MYELYLAISSMSLYYIAWWRHEDRVLRSRCRYIRRPSHTQHPPRPSESRTQDPRRLSKVPRYSPMSRTHWSRRLWHWRLPVVPGLLFSRSTGRYLPWSRHLARRSSGRVCSLFCKINIRYNNNNNTDNDNNNNNNSHSSNNNNINDYYCVRCSTFSLS